VRQVHPGQAQQQQNQHGRQEKRQAGAMSGVMYVLAGIAADLTPAFRDWPGTLGTDQMLAAHLASSSAGAYPGTSTMLDVPTQFPP
jgi:hypothetical protein